jgi:hypothetical protein
MNNTKYQQFYYLNFVYNEICGKSVILRIFFPGESFSKKVLTKAIYGDIIYKSVDEACF